MLKRSLVILALLGAPISSAAQHAVPEIAAPRRDTGVTLTLVGHLLPSSGGALALPMSLLERLAADNALLAVDTAPVAGRVVVQVRFGFADFSEFQRWYAEDRVARLLQEVRATMTSGSAETLISVRRDGVP